MRKTSSRMLSVYWRRRRELEKLRKPRGQHNRRWFQAWLSKVTQQPTSLILPSIHTVQLHQVPPQEYVHHLLLFQTPQIKTPTLPGQNQVSKASEKVLFLIQILNTTLDWPISRHLPLAPAAPRDPGTNIRLHASHHLRLSWPYLQMELRHPLQAAPNGPTPPPGPRSAHKNRLLTSIACRDDEGGGTFFQMGQILYRRAVWRQTVANQGVWEREVVKEGAEGRKDCVEEARRLEERTTAGLRVGSLKLQER